MAQLGPSPPHLQNLLSLSGILLLLQTDILHLPLITFLPPPPSMAALSQSPSIGAKSKGKTSKNGTRRAKG